MSKKSKGRIGVVFSTNPDFEYQDESGGEEKMLLPEKQNLKVRLDSKHRKGKAVTLVENFVGNSDELKALGKILKSKCGVGGSAKDGIIIVQGDFRNKVKDELEKNGYKARVI
jgi:translation initiation factor 1